MTPSGSWPGISGMRTGITPAYCSASLPQMPHASTRSSAAVVVDVGDRQLAQLELARRGLHDRPGGPGRHARARIKERT